MGFTVYTVEGEDVTDERTWLVGKDGTLFYFDDNQLFESEDEYWYAPD